MEEWMLGFPYSKYQQPTTTELIMNIPWLRTHSPAKRVVEMQSHTNYTWISTQQLSPHLADVMARTSTDRSVLLLSVESAVER